MNCVTITGFPVERYTFTSKMFICASFQSVLDDALYCTYWKMPLHNIYKISRNVTSVPTKTYTLKKFSHYSLVTGLIILEMSQITIGCGVWNLGEFWNQSKDWMARHLLLTYKHVYKM